MADTCASCKKPLPMSVASIRVAPGIYVHLACHSTYRGSCPLCDSTAADHVHVLPKEPTLQWMVTHDGHAWTIAPRFTRAGFVGVPTPRCASCGGPRGHAGRCALSTRQEE